MKRKQTMTTQIKNQRYKSAVGVPSVVAKLQKYVKKGSFTKTWKQTKPRQPRTRKQSTVRACVRACVCLCVSVLSLSMCACVSVSLCVLPRVSCVCCVVSLCACCVCPCLLCGVCLLCLCCLSIVCACVSASVCVLPTCVLCGVLRCLSLVCACVSASVCALPTCVLYGVLCCLSLCMFVCVNCCVFEQKSQVSLRAGEKANKLSSTKASQRICAHGHELSVQQQQHGFLTPTVTFGS